MTANFLPSGDHLHDVAARLIRNITNVGCHTLLLSTCHTYALRSCEQDTIKFVTGDQSKPDTYESC